MPTLQLYSPNLYVLFDWETKFNGTLTMQWMRDNSLAVWYCATLYLLLIFGIQSFMQKHKALRLTTALFLWNTFLLFFSLIVAIRSWMEMAYVLRTFGFAYSVCDNQVVYHENVTGLWAWLSILSKMVELGDTLFIVLRKRNLILLHWYHHLVTMVSAWYIYTESLAAGRWFLFMNSTIHSIMYLYYALMTIKVRIPRLAVMSLTILQIMQMVIGGYITYAAFNIKEIYNGCNFPENVALVCVIMYASYFVLFCKYFRDLYLKDSPHAMKKTN